MENRYSRLHFYRRISLWISLLIVMFSIYLSSINNEISALDTFFYDQAIQQNLQPQTDLSEVAVILVDDSSLEALGQRWPLQRTYWAQFFQKISTYNPKMVGLDVWFENPEPLDAVDLALDISDQLQMFPQSSLPQFQQMINTLEEKAMDLNGDQKLSQAIAMVPTYLGMACVQGNFNSTSALITNIEVNVEPKHRCPSLSTTHPIIGISAMGNGSIDVPRDIGQRIRRYAYFQKNPTGTIHSLASVMSELDPERDPIFQKLYRGETWLTFVPSSEINVISFWKILSSDNDPQLKKMLEGKRVIVGVNATGTEDVVLSPYAEPIPGPFIHAIALANLLQKNVLQVVPTEFLSFSMFIVGLFALFLHQNERSELSTLLAIILIIGWITLSYIFLQQYLILPISAFCIGIFLLLTHSIVFDLLQARAEEKRAGDLHKTFQQYLAPEIVENLMNNPEKIKLGGERREITAFFSDVAGFTTISEQLTPDELLALLNECLGEMTEIIIEEGGIIDKYIGDAIVAMFGAPIEQPDHAQRACRAAIRCQKKLDELRPIWIEKGWPEIIVRIGINTGQALVGNMGSDQRFDFTMLGDTVNLAARLEGANKQYDTLIMCGDLTKEQATTISVRQLDFIQVKGKTTGVKVYEVCEEKEQVSETILERNVKYTAGLTAWSKQEWDDAEQFFTELYTQGDGPSGVFLKRIEHMRENPPPKDWNGVFVMKTK